MSRVALNIALGLGAVACLIPAISVNLAGHEARDGAWSDIGIFIVAVLIGAYAAHQLRDALRNREFYVSLICLLTIAFCFSFNLYNAISSSGASRAKFAEPRAAQVERNTRLKEEERQLLESLDSSSGPSLGELEAELEAKEANLLFSRSKQCEEITLADSSVFCNERATLLGKLAVAKTHDANKKRLDEIRRELLTGPATPQLIDPRVDNVLAILTHLGWANEKDRADIGLMIDILIAVFTEFLAMFGPTVVLYRGGKPMPIEEPKGELTEQHQPAINSEAKMPDDLRSFLDARINRRSGARTSAKEICAAFAAAHPGREKPITSAVVGKAVTALFAPEKDQRSNTAVYLGIELLPAEVVKLRA